jgi:putative flavoprotein involved in K+ transport
MPAWRESLVGSIIQLHSSRYLRPDELDEGGVLVVGASASGIQLADELNRAGRRVVLSVGSHTRLPRTYRGRDIHWWLDLSGKLDVTIDQVADPDRARRSPSLQLVGSPDRRSLDLNSVSDAGVELVGRAIGARDTAMEFANDLASSCEKADRRQMRLLDDFDALATAAGFDHQLATPYRPIPTRIPPAPPSIDLARYGITTVLWATGFRPSYPWLRVPVVDDQGRIRHHGGVADWPGLYLMGLPFMRRRRSTVLDGFGADADAIVRHIADYLAGHELLPALTGDPAEGGARRTT